MKKNQKKNKGMKLWKNGFNTDDNIVKFLYEYISENNIVFSHMKKYGGFPGGKTENFFNEGDVRGILNHAIVNTLKFFNSDLKKRRSEETIIGAFKTISKNELTDVYTREYTRELRTVESSNPNEPAYIPTIKSLDSERFIHEEKDIEDRIHSKVVNHKLAQAIANLDEIDKKVINFKMDGYSDCEMAEKLGITIREVKTSLIRAKREIKRYEGLEELCA